MLKCSDILINAVRFKIPVKPGYCDAGAIALRSRQDFSFASIDRLYEAWILFSVAGGNVQLGESLGVTLPRVLAKTIK